MDKFSWNIFVTDEFLNEIKSFVNINDDISDLLSDFVNILSSVGGLKYTEKKYSENERTAIIKSIFHESIKHTINKMFKPSNSFGFYYKNSQKDEFEQECIATPMVNLNIANYEELDALPGIGQVLANSIIEERKQNGIYLNWENFDERVKGVGESLIEDIKSSTYISDIELTKSSTNNLESDFKEVFLLQNDENPKEALKKTLDLISTICSENPHPASKNYYIRSFSDQNLPLVEESEWSSILWGSDYYYKLQELFSYAEKEILVCMFHIAFPEDSHPTYNLLKGLIDAKGRNVSVKVFLDQDKTADPYLSTVINTPSKEFLEQNGIECKFDSVETLLHSKFVIIDTKIVIIGSHNWTAGSYFVFDDLSIISHSESIAKQLKNRFDSLWNQN